MRPVRSIACLLIGALGASVAGWASAEDDMLVGRTAAGQLKIETDFAQPLPLPASVYPGISGYATGELGLHSTILDEPTNDFFQLSSSADLRFILLSKDPGMEVWNYTGSGYLGIGESFYIGPPAFDTHPIWNLLGGIPGIAYSLTLRLHDLNGIYQDSAPLILRFTLAITPVALTLSQTASNEITLAWSTNATGWTPESTPAVTPAAWSPVTNAVDIVGTNFSLNLNTAGAQQYFRLRKQ
jgi:hypothetical protein